MQQRFHQNLIASVVAVASSLCAAMHGTAMAEPVVDRALSGLRFVEKNGCALAKIDFNFRIRYGSHFPATTGTELRVVVHAVDPGQAAALSLLKREALRPPERNGGAIKAIEFVANEPGGPVLRLIFDHPVSFQAAAGSDFQSIVVAISGSKPSVACKPVYPNSPNEGAPRPVAQTPPPAQDPLRVARERSGGVANAAEARQAEGLMDEARAAIKKEDYASAAKIIAQILALPENPSTPNALELLGVTRQKNGQTSIARADYETYLQRYPDGDGAERVRQRLAGITTSESGESSKLRDPKGHNRGEAANTGTTWSLSGSASEFYIRDDSFRTLRDLSLPPDLNADKDAHNVHQNTMLSSFDLTAAWANSGMKSKFRFSGTEEHNFSGKDKDIVAVAALNYEATLRELDLTTRLGRQTRNSSGVLGRFDGIQASWQANPFMRFNTVVGSPVERRKDMPFKDEKWFYGGSVDFGSIWGGLETSLFAIEQRDRGLLDRQAVGAELRYLKPDRSLFGTVDYDVHFNMLNAAVLTGSRTFEDKSSITGSLDYRRAPYLSAWTALQSQPYLRLYDMLKYKTKEEIDQLAIDRTATYKSASFGYVRPLNDKLQLSIDGTIADASGTIASGGVEATLPPGTDYYAAAQLIGQNMFREGDLYIGGLRFAKRPDSNFYVADLSTRIPVSEAFKVTPRLRFGYREGNGTDLKEVTVQPSVLLNYFWTKDLNLELEAGTKWSRLTQQGVRETSTDVFFTAGIRYDFYADGASKCPLTNAVCR